MKKIIKLSSLLFLIIAIFALLYFSITLKEAPGKRIKSIAITGNNLLDTDSYLRFAHLKQLENYLTPAIIKDRIEKHPYIKQVSLSFQGESRILVSLQEKCIRAQLLSGGVQYLLTSDYEVLPVLPNTRNINLPVISNPEGLPQNPQMQQYQGNRDLQISFKLLSALKYNSYELLQNISVIDLRDGRDIIISLCNFGFPVILGRGDEARKVVYLDNLYKYLRTRQLGCLVNYADLRFKGRIYLGLSGDSTSVNRTSL